MKLPGFMFYPGDWMKDPALRSVSYGARGLWQDMLCLMFENDRRGYLQVNGNPVTAEQLARMTGGSTDEVSRYLQELEISGVFSKSQHGMIFSRRLVRDEEQRTREREKKQRQRGGDKQPLSRSCPDVVPMSVPPLSVNEYESEKEVDVGLGSKAFDFEEGFNALYRIYPKRERTYIAQSNYIEAVNFAAKERQLSIPDAAAWIFSRTEIYIRKCRFQVGFEKYLDKKVFAQDESAWEASDAVPKQKQLSGLRASIANSSAANV